MNDENPWISVDDEMPPKGILVRIWSDWANGTLQAEFHDRRDAAGWTRYHNVTHWQHIVGPKKPSSPIMVEAPNKENTYTGEEDPHNMKIGAYLYKKERSAVWWNNTKGKRLWYWHNDKWNRAI